jgi:hypothetical protein
MASPEYNAETVAMALLALSATFSGVTIVHQCEDTDSVTTPNRLTVSCAPGSPAVEPFRPGAPPVSQSELTVTMKTNGAETVFDAWRLAIDSAIMAWRTANLDAPTVALFPNGIEFRPATGGDITQDDRRAMDRVFVVLWRP